MMEKLSEQQRAGVLKMSDARLRNKLAHAGYNPDDLAQLERPDLLELWAGVVVAQLEPTGAVGGVEAEPTDVVGGDEEQEHVMTGPVEKLDLEERRLILEERKLDEQKHQRELDETKWRREIQLREKELDFKKSQAKWEQEQKDNVAAKLKLWGDALRNTISKMPNEPIDVLSWFICLEKLYDQLSVPVELRAVYCAHI